jgi:hypothetical protein
MAETDSPVRRAISPMEIRSLELGLEGISQAFKFFLDLKLG